MTNDTQNQEAPWAAGLRGLKANFVPALALQVGALALVLAYFWHAPTTAFLTRLADWRSEKGAIFAVCSTGFFGGVVPLLYLKSRAPTRARYSWTQGALITLFWAYKGFEIDLWYHGLAQVVGVGNSAGVIVLKMLLDQFVYCPLFAIPVTVLVYDLVEQRGDGAAVWKNFRRHGWYRRSVLPLLISNLGVGVPAVCIIYSLPTAMQLPLQNAVLCFFTLMVAHIAQRPAK